MDRKVFIEKLFARAKEAGLDLCQVHFSMGESFETAVFKGEVLNYSVSDTISLMFSVLVNGRLGTASTQALDDDAIDMLINSAKTNAELIESEDECFMYDGSGEYVEVDSYCADVDAVSAAEKIAYAKKMEEMTVSADERIEQVEDCVVFSESEEHGIVNTLGLDVVTRANVMGGFIAPVARDGELVGSGGKSFVADGADMSVMDKVVSESVAEALNSLNAESMPSGEYPAIFRYDAMRTLLGTFIGVFSADNAQKGLSLLKDREGEKIAADCLTLIDDPHMAKSASSTPFDGEGVPTFRKELISGGVLTTLMHNLKTAHKQNVKTTANATRGGGIAPTNLYIAPGEASFDELVAQIDNGVVITSLQGMHAGANTTSGDFSLSAKGLRVENGKITGAVKQITVATNFFEFIKDIRCVGSDLRFGLPGVSYIGCPSVLVGKISVAGK